LPGRFGLHINVAVVGVPAKPVAPLLQFLVQVVQQYVGQQRDQDPSYTVDNFEFLRSTPFQRRRASGRKEGKTTV
jgi:hypothetical protein